VHNQQPLQRTGTHDLPILQNALSQPMPGMAPHHDYSALTTPSVWRNGRTAAAKVDALASNGMDEIEIPAFLRKQAD
jgi:cell division protein FtsZ